MCLLWLSYHKKNEEMRFKLSNILLLFWVMLLFLRSSSNTQDALENQEQRQKFLDKISNSTFCATSTQGYPYPTYTKENNKDKKGDGEVDVVGLKRRNGWRCSFL